MTPPRPLTDPDPDPTPRQLRPALVLAIDRAIQHAHANGRLNVSPAVPLDHSDYAAAYDAFTAALDYGMTRTRYPTLPPLSQP